MEQGQRRRNEILVFAELQLKEDLVKELKSSKIVVDKKSYALGMPLRITTDQISKAFFEIPLKMWKETKGSMRITFRLSGGKTIQLNDSTRSEVEKLISELP